MWLHGQGSVASRGAGTLAVPGFVSLEAGFAFPSSCSALKGAGSIGLEKRLSSDSLGGSRLGVKANGRLCPADGKTARAAGSERPH